MLFCHTTVPGLGEGWVLTTGLTLPHTNVPVTSQEPVVQWLSLFNWSFIVICLPFLHWIRSIVSGCHMDIYATSLIFILKQTRAICSGFTRCSLGPIWYANSHNISVYAVTVCLFQTDISIRFAKQTISFKFQELTTSIRLDRGTILKETQKLKQQQQKQRFKQFNLFMLCFFFVLILGFCVYRRVLFLIDPSVFSRFHLWKIEFQ